MSYFCLFWLFAMCVRTIQKPNTGQIMCRAHSTTPHYFRVTLRSRKKQELFSTFVNLKSCLKNRSRRLQGPAQQKLSTGQIKTPLYVKDGRASSVLPLPLWAQ